MSTDIGEVVTELPDENKKRSEDAMQEATAEPTNPLAEIVSGRVSGPRRLFLYGIPGIGKSTFASKAPNPIFVPTEDGIDDIDVAKFPLSKNWGEFWGRLQSLAENDHDYKSVVVDTSDWLERLIHAEVCCEKGVTTIDEIGYGKGYIHSIAWWEKFLSGLDYLRDKKQMNVIVLAHSQVVKFENPETDSYDRYVPKMHKTATSILTEWADEVFFASNKVLTNTTEGAFGKKEIKAMATDQRVMRCVERPYCVAKNRLNMPVEVPFEWDEYAEYFAK